MRMYTIDYIRRSCVGVLVCIAASKLAGDKPVDIGNRKDFGKRSQDCQLLLSCVRCQVLGCGLSACRSSPTLHYYNVAPVGYPDRNRGELHLVARSFENNTVFINADGV